MSFKGRVMEGVRIKSYEKTRDKKNRRRSLGYFLELKTNFLSLVPKSVWLYDSFRPDGDHKNLNNTTYSVYTEVSVGTRCVLGKNICFLIQNFHGRVRLLALCR